MQFDRIIGNILHQFHRILAIILRLVHQLDKFRYHQCKIDFDSSQQSYRIQVVLRDRNSSRHNQFLRQYIHKINPSSQIDNNNSGIHLKVQ